MPGERERKWYITERKIIDKLLAKGFNVYLPEIDDQGVDMIVQPPDKDEYKEVQIKHSKKFENSRKRDFCFHIPVSTFKANSYRFFILVGETGNHFVIPAKDFEIMGKSIRIRKKGKPQWDIDVKLRNEKWMVDTIKDRDRIDISGYENRYDLLY